MRAVPTSEPLPADLVPLAAAARHVGIHPKTLYRWCERGLLRGWRVGHRWRCRRADLLALVGVSVPNEEVQAREERARELEEVDAVLRAEGVRR